MTADDLAALEAKMLPAPWRWKQTGPIDWGYVGPGDEWTVLFGERGEGEVDADDTDAVALVALRNHARLLIAALRVAEADAEICAALRSQAPGALRAGLAARDAARAAFRAERDGGGV